MRILVAIPLYYAARRRVARRHGSVGQGTPRRIAALSACIAAPHQLYGPAQHVIDQATRVAMPANRRTAGRVDVVACTTGEGHLLDQQSRPESSFTHHPTDASAPLLGFECHAVLRDRLGGYD